MDKTAKTKAVARHKAKPVKYPTKTSINMMTCGLPQHTGRTLSIGVCLIALLVAFVVKVGVYDQLARLDRAESAYQTVHQQNLTLQERVADYEEVLLAYRAHAMNFVSGDAEDTVVIVDRQAVLDLIEETMLTKGTLVSISLHENTAVVNMSGMNLKQISQMNAKLKQRGIVRDVQLKLAQTEEERAASVLNFTDTIYLQTEEAKA